MQVCTSLQTDNHASTHHSFLQARCPSCHPTNSVKALKALKVKYFLLIQRLKYDSMYVQISVFSTLTLLVGWREGHAACKETKWWGAGMVICLERGADLHMAQLMPLPLTVPCFSKIQIGFTFLVPAHPGSPRQRAVTRVCVCRLTSEHQSRQTSKQANRPLETV